MAQEELDRLHPSLVPPDDEQLDDLVNDERDGVYQKGLQMAEEIRSETSLQGRMRRPLLARLTKQQQHDQSSSKNRTRTIRPFGGGVISDTTAYGLLPLPGATTTTTTTATCGTATTAEVVAMVAATVAVAACDEREERCRHVGDISEASYRTDTGLLHCRSILVLAHKPSVRLITHTQQPA